MRLQPRRITIGRDDLELGAGHLGVEVQDLKVRLAAWLKILRLRLLDGAATVLPGLGTLKWVRYEPKSGHYLSAGGPRLLFWPTLRLMEKAETGNTIKRWERGAGSYHDPDEIVGSFPPMPSEVFGLVNGPLLMSTMGDFWRGLVVKRNRLLFFPSVGSIDWRARIQTTTQTNWGKVAHRILDLVLEPTDSELRTIQLAARIFPEARPGERMSVAETLEDSFKFAPMLAPPK